MSSLSCDLRYALRVFRRSPGFTGLVILMLALGIGASTAIFSAVNGVLLRPLPYDSPSRLVFLGTTLRAQQPSYSSIPEFIDWTERVSTIEGLAASQRTELVLAGDGAPERVKAARVSPGFFSTLGAAPQLGRIFSAEEHETGADPVVILSHSIWQRRWGGDPNVIGTTFRSEYGRSGLRSFNVAGVMPAGFQAPEVLLLQGAEIWMALPVDGEAYASDRTSRSLRVIGRVKSGVGLEAVQQEIDALAAAMAAEHPEAYTRSDGTLGIGVASLLEMTVGRTRLELLILLSASALLLFIACANVANLLLARSTRRDKEIALRVAIGAGRTRIARQLLTESICLGLLGGFGGILIAYGAVDAFRIVGPSDFPRLAEVTVDPIALGFAVGLALLTGILFGLAPAFLGSKIDLNEALKEGGGRVSSASGRTRYRSVLVAAETALAFVVLAGAGLLINSYLRLQSVDLGFNPDNLLMMEVGLSRSYSSNERRAAFFKDLTDRVAAIPEVESASFIVDPPIGYVMWTPPVYVEGVQPQEEPPWIAAHMVGPDYFETMGIRLQRGRGFTSRDDTGQPMVAIVNETMAREFWPGMDPVGRRMKLSPDPEAPWLTVVGLVNDVRQYSLASPAESEFYVPYAQHAWFRWNQLVVRTEADPATMVGPMRQAVWDVDPTVPFEGVVAMSDRISASLQAPRFRTLLLSGFAIVALLLAAGGMYATMAYAVGQRTHEIGIRMALGSDASSVLSLVLRQGMRIAVIGTAAGLVAALATSRVLESIVFEVEPTDPTTLAGITGIVVFAALLACYLPARRATRIDPMIALRKEF